MSNDPYAPREADPDYQYSPVNRGLTFREVVRKIFAPVVAFSLLLVKFGAFSIKFFGIFISVGGYALIWGWRFAVGFTALILVHELGHYLEARRQGLHPALPVFIPFLGAYVAIKDAPFDPWRNLLISAAGPLVGGLGALGVWIAGDVTDSRLLLALAYTGFFLNLFNLLPVKPLDGGYIWLSIKTLRAGAREHQPWAPAARATASVAIYVGLILALVVGMLGAHTPQDRL